MNFFNEFLVEKQNIFLKSARTGLIALIVFSALFGVYAYYSRQYYDLTTELAEVEFLLADPAFVRVKEETSRENKKLAELKRYHSAISAINERFAGLHHISAAENEDIFVAFPLGVYLSGFSVQGVSVSFNGSIDDIKLLPAIIQNLEDTGLFSVITNTSSGINSEADSEDESILPEYNFSLNCTLKGGEL